MIKDEVEFKNHQWQEIPLTNDEIISKLEDEKDESFLSFAYRCMGNSFCKVKLT